MHASGEQRWIEEEIRRDRLKDIHGVRFGFVGSRRRGIVTVRVCRAATFDDKQGDENDVNQKNQETSQSHDQDDRQRKSLRREIERVVRRRVRRRVNDDLVRPLAQIVGVVRAEIRVILAVSSKVVERECLSIDGHVFVGVERVRRSSVANVKCLRSAAVETRIPMDHGR